MSSVLLRKKSLYRPFQRLRFQRKSREAELESPSEYIRMYSRERSCSTDWEWAQTRRTRSRHAFVFRYQKQTSKNLDSLYREDAPIPVSQLCSAYSRYCQLDNDQTESGRKMLVPGQYQCRETCRHKQA